MYSTSTANFSLPDKIHRQNPQKRYLDAGNRISFSLQGIAIICTTLKTHQPAFISTEFCRNKEAHVICSRARTDYYGISASTENMILLTDTKVKFTLSLSCHWLLYQTWRQSQKFPFIYIEIFCLFSPLVLPAHFVLPNFLNFIS